MISISAKKLSFINKTVFILVAIYSLIFISYTLVEYYRIYNKKNSISQELQTKKNETKVLKNKVSLVKKKIKDVKKQYLTEKELESKVKGIFQRMSIFDYQINYLGAKKMCIDRYLLITEVDAQSEEGLTAAKGILSYLGNIKKSEDYESVYFVDYMATPKRIK